VITVLADTAIRGHDLDEAKAAEAHKRAEEALQNRTSKLEYAKCVAAALSYLILRQQDSVGLVTFDDKIRESLAPHSKRTQLGHLLALLVRLEPKGMTEVARCLHQLAAMVRHRSLLMLFSDLLCDPEPVVKALHHLRHRGNDVIVFHILDEAETQFPFEGVVELEETESGERLTVDAEGIRADYREALSEFTEMYRRECFTAGVDYVQMDTSTPFDKALMEYLVSRRARF